MMRGDSFRIKGMKVLAEDKSDSRFEKARKNYEKAIGYYNESILYDERGNPEVFYKLGETYMLLEPPDLKNARSAFKNGLDQLKKGFLAHGLKSEAYSETTSNDLSYLNIGGVKHTSTDYNEREFSKRRDLYAQMHAGMGVVNFLKGVETGESGYFAKAMEFFDVGESISSKLKKPEVASLETLWDFLNLSELVHPVAITHIKGTTSELSSESCSGQGNEDTRE